MAKLSNLTGKKFSERLVAWYDQNARDLPWRRFWKTYRNPYHVWLSEIMLQQTLIKVVEPRYLDFVEKFPDLQSVARATESQMREAFRGLGYYRRFRLFHQAAQDLCAKSSDTIRLPSSFDEWLEVSGVGPYVAAAISSITLNEPKAVLDGNVERVLCRIDGLEIIPNIPASKKLLQKRAQDLLHNDRPGDYNQAIMELGQRICTPTKPDCVACPVQSFCQSYAQKIQDRCPLPKQRPEFADVQLRLTIQLAPKAGVAIHARPETAHFLGGISGFVTEVYFQGDWRRDENKLSFGAGTTPAKKSAPAKLSTTIHAPNPTTDFVGTIRHNITRHRIVAEVFVIKDKAAAHSEGRRAKVAQWLPPSEVESHLVSNLDRKAWKLLIRSRPGIL